MRVVICGGGVIGACTAYFLCRHGVDVVVVERVEAAAAASGKAGGFLARDWCAGTPLDALARRSFALHAQLPDEIGGDWGYRPMTAHSGFVAADDDPRRDAPTALGWLSKGVVLEQRIGTKETTAIVHPYKFTSAVMNAALAQGAELRVGCVTGIRHDADGTTVKGVEVGKSVIEADAIVIAMGPWSLLAAQWVNLPAINGQLGSSIVYDTGTEVSADALFLESDFHGTSVPIEVFPRADGTTYVTAVLGNTSFPTDPAAVDPEPYGSKVVQMVSERLSPLFRPENIIAWQSCFRPRTEDGLPLIGRVPNHGGVYIATGHDVWGILNAPATGEALAQLIVMGATRGVDLTPFDPARLSPMDAVLQAR